MRLRVLRAGMLTTVQDLGRFGYAHLGISPAGAADALSFRIANVLVGNGENEPALEMTLTGASLEFESRAVVSVTGGKVMRKGADPLPMWRAIEVPGGEVLDFGPVAQGVRAYLAVQGGVHVPLRMQSASTHLAAGFGGWQGRALRKGDVLQYGASPHGSVRELNPGFLKRMGSARPIRVTRGLQWEWFENRAVERFLAAGYTVSDQWNRAGLRLSGEPIRPAKWSELLTEGVSLGAIQIPPDGQPIILFIDLQTTGGYPKIANAIAADLHRIGQLRPTDLVRFELVSLECAVHLLREQEEAIAEAFIL
jgi:antagonist of KipI